MAVIALAGDRQPKHDPADGWIELPDPTVEQEITFPEADRYHDAGDAIAGIRRLSSGPAQIDPADDARVAVAKYRR